MSVLEIKNIEKSFGGSRVLKDISIQVVSKSSKSM